MSCLLCNTIMIHGCLKFPKSQGRHFCLFILNMNSPKFLFHYYNSGLVFGLIKILKRFISFWTKKVIWITYQKIYNRLISKLSKCKCNGCSQNKQSTKQQVKKSIPSYDCHTAPATNKHTTTSLNIQEYSMKIKVPYISIKYC